MSTEKKQKRQPKRPKTGKGGYCDPPVASQFQPGQSGNRKGRPKGSKNLKTDLEDELNETIEFTERGERKTTSKRRAILKQLAAKAIKGDIRAATLLLKYAQDTDQSKQPESVDDDLLDTEAKRLREFVLREARKLKDTG
ncbi:MAG TPA: hypothetical protein EYG02_00265 [Henriciella marina]|uniref:DUF5681 domain-containing protein n=1 Tax=Henriciella sp. TaxID=1968823 RepID=UPI0017A75060|nr:DUF5681 domain-containing protein [Henriciella sp.]HIG22897.1 hypothetical protein [Henriciella sp.]HIK63444.1 hypothetical protein [Henriciella marina]